MAFRKARSEDSKRSGSKKGSGGTVSGRVAEAKKSYLVETREDGAPKKKAVYRSAVTGRFVTAEQQAASPRTTVLLKPKIMSGRHRVSDQTPAGRGSRRSSKPSERWTATDETVITRLANAAERSQTEDGHDISGLSEADLLKALFG